MTIYSTLPNLMIFPGPNLVILYVADIRHSRRFLCTPLLPSMSYDIAGDLLEPNFLVLRVLLIWIKELPWTYPCKSRQSRRELFQKTCFLYLRPILIENYCIPSHRISIYFHAAFDKVSFLVVWLLVCLVIVKAVRILDPCGDIDLDTV
jgi:hypothetical protein